MAMDERYEVLFTPVKIGPVTTSNRFYQTPHCTGAGITWPHTVAGLRGMKAEGGWGVVNTEYCSIHPTGDPGPRPAARLWHDEDVKANALTVEAIKKHGALAGCETMHTGVFGHNRLTRMPIISPSARPTLPGDYYGQSQVMDKSDIAAFRRWHREGVERAITAGFDIVFVYVGHSLTLFTDFLSPRINRRTDEYGGSVENRARLTREVLEETMEVADGKAAVAIRFCVDEMMGDDGITAEDGRAVVEMLAEVPDLWDVNAGGMEDMATSRFVKEGWEEPHIAFVKQMTTKPVVGCGRYTSPDAMLSAVKKGIVDLVGCARASIADPFLPNKIRDGRTDDIRECIGCNICLSSHSLNTPLRCTQNPTMGEEWRRGWHPEAIPPKATDGRVLVVGAGPAGLEAARAAGQRGYAVALADAATELGGHLNTLTRLPRLNEWARVRDWRIGQIQQMANVEIYLDSPLAASDVLEFGADHVAIATGATWLKDGVGHHHVRAISGCDQDHVFSPADVMAGQDVTGPVVIYDDDRYAVGPAIAEQLRALNHDVTLVTPAPLVSDWSHFGFDQHRVQTALVELGVHIIASHTVTLIGDGEVEIAGVFGEPPQTRPAASVVIVAMREADDGIYRDLADSAEKLDSAGIRTLTRIGDCLAPGLIAEAVFAGHDWARGLDGPKKPMLPFRVEQVPAAFEPPLPYMS